jgi:hypothetical protein
MGLHMAFVAGNFEALRLPNDERQHLSCARSGVRRGEYVRTRAKRE